MVPLILVRKGLPVVLNKKQFMSGRRCVKQQEIVIFTHALKKTNRTGKEERKSALHDVDSETTPGGLLVLGIHVPTGLPHGTDDLVQ